MQPALQSIFLAGLLAYFQIRGPTLGERYLPLMRDMVDGEMRAKLMEPSTTALFDALLVSMIPFFILFGIFIGIVAWRCKTMTWLLWRGVGFWILLFAFVVVRMLVFLLQSR